MTDFLGMQKDESSVNGTPGVQVRSIKGLLDEEVTPQSGRTGVHSTDSKIATTAETSN